MFLANGSLLLGDAANASDGGDIAIATDFVIAIPDENSDIIVNAVEGRGGVIDITATGVYGLTPQNAATTAELRDNRSSDISASSQFGQPGIIAISAIDVDPSDELDDLTADFINSDSLIASSCIRSSQDGDSSLTVIGSENLPQQPGNSASSIYSATTVQTIPAGSTHQAIHEPEAIYQLADGRLILSHWCDR